MRKKIKAFIISVFLFMFSFPPDCFAQLGAYLAPDNNPEISCAVSKAVNLLDISGKIAKVCYDGAKDFFFNISIQNGAGGAIPVYTSSDINVFLGISSVAAAGGKKNAVFENKVLRFSGFFKERLRGSPPLEAGIIKQYLLCIEALRKGSVPAFDFIALQNILFQSPVCL